MAISYSSEGYKVTPQFANLGALQGLQPLDVTRHASFEPRALTPINIPAPPPMIIPPSSRPELVTEGIAQGIQAAVGGITGAITAHYAAKAETAKEGRKYAHEKELMTIRASAKDDTLERQKALIDYRATKERLKGSLGDSYPIYLYGQTGEVKQDSESNVINGDVGGDVSDSATQIDFDTSLPELGSESDSLGAISPAQAIQERVVAKAKGLENLSPEYISASMSGANVAPEVPPKQAAETKQVRGEFRQTLAGLEAPKTVKRTQIEPQRPGFYPIEKAQEEASREIPGWKPAEIDEKTVKTVGGQTFFLVKPRKAMTQKEISEEKKGIDTGVNFETEKKLRDEYIGQTKDFKTIQSAWRSIKTSGGEPSAASDMSLIFGYMKLLDPGSTVREGEYANAQNAGSVSDKIISLYNKAVDGKFLSDPQRQDFLGQAKKQYDSRLGEYGNLKKSYTQLSKEYNLDPKRVVVEFDMPEEIAKDQVQKNKISSLSMDLEQTPVDQRQSPEFLAKRKALYELIKQEELKKKKPTPVTPVSQPIQQPIFQPATPRSTGETLESFIGNK